MSEGVRRPETRDADPRALLAFGGGLVAFLAVSLVALYLVFGNVPSPLPFGAGAGLDPGNGPLLQTQPKRDYAAYAAEKARALQALSPIAEEPGYARIPIEDAMAIIAERGLPSFDKRGSSENAECALLMSHVPRAPQSARCRESSGR
jgi:hypothetical protein